MEERKELDYDIDGLVIKERNVNHEDASRDRPDRQIAFKFSLEEAVSVVRKVEWNESGATYTPVAVFDPVDLNGTTVQRASLANPNLIRSLGLKIGSHVVVVKRGEIIPKIESVVPSEDENLSEIEFPEICSTCGSRLIDEGTRLYCPGKDCSKRILHRLLKWVSVVDIRDLGETLVRSLFRDKVVQSVTDIYNLTVEKITPYFLNEESISQEKKSLGAEKVYRSIQNHRSVSLSKFIAGFDIEGIGETIVEKLIEAGYNSLDSLFEATQEQIAGVYGFADILAETFVQGLKENKEEMKNLIQSGALTVEQIEGGKLVGKSFCFTGELRSMKRADAQNLVKQNGGSVKSSVVKGLSYLVTNDTSSGSSKNKKAAELGIPVINEEAFLALL
jgi:DNA ligase (NAD+)